MNLNKYFIIFVLLPFSVNNVFAQESNEQKKQTLRTVQVNKADTIPYALPSKSEASSVSSEQATVIPLLEKEKCKCEINDFLDMENDSIFNHKFKYFDLSKMHSRNKLYYQLISNIHDLDSLLLGIGKMTGFQYRNINIDIENARKKIEIINSFATEEKKKVTDFLSEKQKLYFRACVATYNKITQ